MSQSETFKLDLARVVAYLEMARAALNEAQELAARNRLENLTDSLGAHEADINAACKELYRRLGL